MPITICVAGTATGAAAQDLATAGVTSIVVAEHAALSPYTPDGLTQALVTIIERLRPTLVLFAHTYQTRDFAPMLAARLRKPLITDATGIRGSGAGATFVRPMFQGKLSAEVRPLGDAPFLITFQIGAFRADAVQRGSAAPISTIDLVIDPAAIRQQPEPPFQEARQAVDLGQAERIVAVGRGIKSQEHLPVAE